MDVGRLLLEHGAILRDAPVGMKPGYLHVNKINFMLDPLESDESCELVKLIAEKDAMDESLRTHILTIACGKGDLESAVILMEHGAGEEIGGKVYPISPLAKACEYEHLEVVRELLKRKFNINHLSWRRYLNTLTPLTFAVWKKNMGIAKELIKYGADINIGGTYGNPLLMAVDSGDMEMVQHLLDLGAEVDRISSWVGIYGVRNRITPLFVAIILARYDIAELLLTKANIVFRICVRVVNCLCRCNWTY